MPRTYSNKVMSKYSNYELIRKMEDDEFTTFSDEAEMKKYIKSFKTNGSVYVKYINRDRLFRNGGLLVNNHSDDFFTLKGIGGKQFTVRYDSILYFFHKLSGETGGFDPYS